ncbi:MAG: hypothetical protein Q7R41_10085 [Phycisphaerales bacterium]|nr:hypothetical protein [Phycisphaerales bacterium]
MRIRFVIGSLIALVVVAPSLGETPLTTAFTYQGQLKAGGAPFDGTADFVFTLWDAAGSGNPPTGGTQVGDVQPIIALPVTAGLFTVTLNAGGEFGANAFNGNARWLDITVRNPAGGGFITLAPRQPLTAAPYALSALRPWNKSGSDVFYDVGNVGIGGPPVRPLHVSRGQAIAQLQTLSNTFGSVIELKNSTADPTLLGGINFLTSTDSVPGQIAYHAATNELSFRVNGVDALKIVPNLFYPSNPVTLTVSGAGGVLLLGGIQESVNRFGLRLYPASGHTAGVYFDPTVNQTIVLADVKNFHVPNPDDPTTEIWYASVEGPEAAAYVRGTAELKGGTATVRLPDHFRHVAVEAGMTVQLTPRSAESKGLAVVEQTPDHFVVKELFQGTGGYEFHWEVKAVRKGHEEYRVIRPSMSSDARGLHHRQDAERPAPRGSPAAMFH